MRTTSGRIAPQFETEDIARAAAWYAALGFAVAERNAATARLSFDGEPLFLVQADDPQPSRAVVDRGARRDVGRLFERCESERLTLHAPLGSILPGFRGFTVCDPDGNLLTFLQRAPPALRLVPEARGAQPERRRPG